MIPLVQALRLPPDVRLALVGAGGKTSALFQIARELPPPVFVTATTHLAEAELDLADEWQQLDDPARVELVGRQGGEVVKLFIGALDETGRRQGLAAPVLERLKAIAEGQRIPLLIEADGSRRLPLKAPGDHEPALPFSDLPGGARPALDMVVVVAGLTGLGKPLGPEWVHRPERFAALTGEALGAPLSVQAVGRLLLHPQGGLKNIPQGVRRVVLLNQADTSELQSLAYSLIGGSGGEINLLSEFNAVVVASLQSKKIWAVHEPVAGVILAAGGGSRFGGAKQMLAWQGETLVHRAARTALEGGLYPVIVVTGAYAGEIQAAVADLPVRLAHNPNWEAGQGGSVGVGVDALPERLGAVVFLLADQPLVSPDLIRGLVEAHAESLPAILAPLAGGRRANPVLFDRATFADLRSLQGDQGGRQLFARYAPAWLPWHDESILLEIDTPEDYRRFQELDSR